jgi:glycosyltransferase involved in cell wall biosynthesis
MGAAEVRIAYVAPYQGDALIRRRPSARNLSLAARVKIALIAELLKKRGHSVDVLAQGEVIEPALTFYPGFQEPERFDPDIPVHYASALPIRGVTGFWSAANLLRLFKRLHRKAPYDVLLIYNLKLPQVACARHAVRLGLPVILQYEDDSFANVWGQRERDIRSGWQRTATRKLFDSLSGCAAVSPYLLSQLPGDMPKVLLRGIVSGAIASFSPSTARKNWVVFSGTHERTQGLEQLITAWRSLDVRGWELHIAGAGPITGRLQEIAANDPSIVFHGLLDRRDNAMLLCSARIGMNPQDNSQTAGNVFAFKIIEYLAAGLHVITTPRGEVERELERGITYISDNVPETIAGTLEEVIGQRRYERSAAAAAMQAYGPDAVAASLNDLIARATTRRLSVKAS